MFTGLPWKNEPPYQELGQPDSARVMYQKFVAAWDGADPRYQPIVDRAREAIRALEGRTQAPVR